MARRLERKTALVTGATGNIGRAIAEAFAAEGAHVVISGRSADRGAQVADGIGSRGGRADFVMAELDGSAEASRALAGQATSVLGGRIDILVNNAGIYPGDSTAATDEKTFDRVYAVNVKAPFFLTAAIAPAMAAGRQRGDHQPGLLDRASGHSCRRALQLHQGRAGDPDAGLGRGVRPARRAGQRDLPRCGADPGAR